MMDFAVSRMERLFKEEKVFTDSRICMVLRVFREPTTLMVSVVLRMENLFKVERVSMELKNFTV